MKKILVLIVTFLTIAGNAFALDWTLAVSPSLVTTQLIATGAGTFAGIAIATDGTNSVNFNIYDNTSATGKKILPTFTVPTSATARFTIIQMPGKSGTKFTNGLYVSASSAGTFDYRLYLGQ